MPAPETIASIRSHGGESKTGGTSPASFCAGLNPEQAAAVSADPDGAQLILAGAGSGKTTVLTRRAAYLLDPARGACGVLALTFTKDAALEMESRLRASGAWDRAAAPPWIGTFHAFAYALIRGAVPAGMSSASGFRREGDKGNGDGSEPWRRLGFARSPRVLEEGAAEAWIGAALAADRAAGNPVVATPASIAAALADPFDAARDEAAQVAGMPDPLRREWRARYRSHLLAEGLIAFDDMVALALRLLRADPALLASCRAAWPRILVDEFQDTSRDQLDLVRLLAGDPPRVFLVGDDDQAIYGFRGADPRNLRAAMEMFPGLRVRKLETNYRSSEAIVAYANSVFRGKPAALRKRLRAGSARGRAPVRTLIHRDGAEQMRWMAGEMRRLRETEGLAWSDMAVLFRLNVLEPYYRSAVEILAGPEAAREVVFATVHAAKGLEYPAVFFTGLEDGVLPHRLGGAPLPPERLEEERRIFYVGVTRAQRFLYLCACRSRITRGKAVRARPSPFLRRGWPALGGVVAEAVAIFRARGGPA